MQTEQQKAEQIEREWNEFWKAIVCNPDVSINVEQLKKELYDFRFLIREAPKVYEHVTGGILSKPMHSAETVIKVSDDYYEKLYELKPDQNEDFVDGDFVFIEIEGGGVEYFELKYIQEMYAWMLVPFTDKTFSTPKTDDKGNVEAEFLYEYSGVELLQKVTD